MTTYDTIAKKIHAKGVHFQSEIESREKILFKITGLLKSDYLYTCKKRDEKWAGHTKFQLFFI